MRKCAGIAAIGIITIAMMLTTQSAVAQKRIIFIYSTTPATNEAPEADMLKHDDNLIAALGGAGLTAEGSPVPGLGYQLVLVEGADDVDDYTSTDGDLIFISQTVSSGDPGYHMDDALPLINTEAALMNNSDPPRCELYFGSGEGSPDGVEFDIVDNTHPITEIFTTGPLALGQGDGEIGYAGGTLATNVIALATVPGNAGQISLGLAETGTSGLVPPGAGLPPGVEPLPAARVLLGYHAGLFTTPTVNGVILLQRTVQWAIGDPVTAGGATEPPAAPTDLTAEIRSGLGITLTWTDNADNESGFDIERMQLPAGAWGDIGQVASNITLFLDQNVVEGTSYTYRVQAVNAIGDSAYSSEVSILFEPPLGSTNWGGYR